jgi:hypothetical protein
MPAKASLPVVAPSLVELVPPAPVPAPPVLLLVVTEAVAVAPWPVAPVLSPFPVVEAAALDVSLVRTPVVPAAPVVAVPVAVALVIAAAPVAVLLPVLADAELAVTPPPVWVAPTVLLAAWPDGDVGAGSDEQAATTSALRILGAPMSLLMMVL